MLQTKFFSAQHKVAEELSFRYANVICDFSSTAFDGKRVFEQYTCYNNEIEKEKIHAQFCEKEDSSIEVKIFKLTQLATHKI